jgi:hypothetical protein
MSVDSMVALFAADALSGQLRDDHQYYLGFFMAISLAQAKSLCSENELALVLLSTRSEIGKLSAGQLRLKIKRARDLRDKWSDQSRKQRRATQAAQKARDTDANARSAKKAQLFEEALGRFESQLAKLESDGKSGNAAPKRVAARERSAGHRAARAEIRDSLKQDRLKLKQAGKRSKPVVAKPAAEAKPVAADAASEQTVEKATRGDKAKAGGKRARRGKKAPASAGLTALQAGHDIQGLHVTEGTQLRARTAAKQSRLKTSGLIRIQKSTSAANKRRQAKRDGR